MGLNIDLYTIFGRKKKDSEKTELFFLLLQQIF